MGMPEWWRNVVAVSDALDVVVDDDLSLIFRAAQLADAFVGTASELTQDQRRQVLGTLEEALCQGSEDDAAAVATGFLEALLNAWDNGFDLRLVWDDLGPESQSYCLAWNKFWGIKSPEWMRSS
ncbi:hypothetical protein GCM10010193_14000 [Kitasatospora atroaurantiaca]|uniref:Uncharacterized protein n=1 Tax=Kitasatospora atroaurantiaca TaxID=285545 RepID=A0A561F213_9ACTN|nr:hypothetical protein [Kitasatospora atroaurantiaca]TWE21905.1 hypothetical protein FB465_7154 [Kitasatospora atroaurantiaca]